MGEEAGEAEAEAEGAEEEAEAEEEEEEEEKEEEEEYEVECLRARRVVDGPLEIRRDSPRFSRDSPIFADIRRDSPEICPRSARDSPEVRPV